MSKKLRVDFFKVGATPDFAALLRRVQAMALEERNFTFGDGPVRLRVSEESGSWIAGDMIRIRLGEPAFLAKIHGGERELTQDEDEGLGETNAFLYSTSSGYLAYQFNRSGVSANKASFYFQQKCQSEEALLFDPVLAQVFIEQLLGRGAPRRLRVKVAAGGVEKKSAQDAALCEVIEAAHQMESPEMEITFGMGRRRKGGMSKENVISFVRSVLRLRSAGHDVVKALEVMAPPESGGGKAELLDFIDATAKSIQSVESSTLVEEFYRRRQACVRAAWDEHAADLR